MPSIITHGAQLDALIDTKDGAVTSRGLHHKNMLWVFTSLWHAAGSKECGSIIIHVPDTVLFIGGAPTKWLGTNNEGNQHYTTM